MGRLELRSIFFFLMLFFISSTSRSQNQRVEPLSQVLDETTESICLDILEYYKDQTTYDIDSLRKYAKMLIQYYPKDEITVHLTTAKSYLLQAESSAPFAKYAVIASDLIDNYKFLAQYEEIVDAQYHLANKAHMSGMTESFNLYQDGLAFLRANEQKLVDTLFCKLQSRYLSSIASNYEYVGLYEEAVRRAIQAVEYAESCPDKSGQLVAYLSAGAIIGNASNNLDEEILNSIGAQDNLMAYLKRTKVLAEELEEHYDHVLACSNLAFYYFDIGDYDRALNYLDESQKIQGWETFDRAQHLDYIMRSDISFYRGDIQQAEYYLMQSHNAALRLNEPLFAAKSYLDLASWEYDMQHYSQALFELSNIDTSLNDNLWIQKEINSTKADIYRKMGDHKSALEASDLYHLFKDSISNKNTNLSISSMVTNLNLEKLKAEAKEAELQHIHEKGLYRRNVFIGSLALLVLGLLSLLTFILYNRRLVNSRLEVEQTQQQLFRAQMNPHFIFNTLGTIQSFLLQKDRSKDGAYYLSKFAKLMRKVLSQSQKELVSLEEEVETIENYMVLQKMRYDHRFDYNIKIDPSINRSSLKVPPMLIQPIVENAIEHGKVYNQIEGLITVSVKKMADSLLISIKDNGVGIDNTLYKDERNQEKEKSYSLEIVRNRLKLLEHEYKVATDVQFERLESGTLVTLVLPLLK